MYSARSTRPNHLSLDVEITRERIKEKALLNLKRSYSAMSSNSNHDDMQFRDDGDVVFEGRGSVREDSSDGAADEDEHRYSTVHPQNMHRQDERAIPSSLLSSRQHSHSLESAPHHHSRMMQQIHYPSMHGHHEQQEQHNQFQYQQQNVHTQSYSSSQLHETRAPLVHQQRGLPGSMIRDPHTPQYQPPPLSQFTVSALKPSSTEFIRQQHPLMQYMGTPATTSTGNVAYRNASTTPRIGKASDGVATGGGAFVGGGFGIVGQTPPTGGSYGSFAASIPTPQQQQQQQQQVVGVGGFDTYPTFPPGTVIHRPPEEGGGMRVGGLHGNTRFQPTPVVPRGGGGGGVGGDAERHYQSIQQQQQMMMRMQSPGMQYHISLMQSEMPPQPQQQQQRFSSQRKHHPSQSQEKVQRKKLDPVMEENQDEDPSMLRYESRPGMDASPMVETTKQDGRHVVGNVPGMQGLIVTANKKGTEEKTDTPLRPDGVGELKHGTIGQISRLGPFPSSHGLSGDHPNRATVLGPPVDQTAAILHEFPFFFDGFAAWVCQHCQHIPPYYRGANYVWQSSQPPPNSFVDSHLRICHGLNSMPQLAFPGGRMRTSQAVFDSSVGFPLQQPQVSYPYAHTLTEYPLNQQPSMSQQSYDSSSSQRQHQGEAPDPPGVTSPVPVTKHHGMKREREERVLAIRESTSAVHPQNRLSLHDSQLLPYPYHQHPSNTIKVPPQKSAAAVSAGAYPTYMQAPLSTVAPTAHHHDVETEETPPRAAKKRKTSSCKTSPKGRLSDDDTYKSSIDFLSKRASEKATSLTAADSDVGQYLTDKQDANLLTDYFFHIMQQLVICRFSEKDRKTRGGKRENVDIGYGGLQCVHCINTQKSRKFFWSTVDRLANSFAEIPSHILKCKHCPDEVRDALLVLKGRHHDQIQTLPRGSQKVFFRRVWRRLHDNAGKQGATLVRDEQVTPTNKRSTVDPPMSTLVAFAETALMSPDVSVSASNRLLASAAKSLEIQSSKGSVPDAKCERILLAIPDDKNWLSDNDCFIRNNIEIFTANQTDVERAAADRKYPIKLGQVGIRCVHCAMASGGANCGAVSYPYSISGIYESVREFQRLHFVNCPHIPQDVKVRSEKLVGGSSSLSSVLRRYYVQAARALGLFDTQDDGVRAGGKPIPLPTSGFFQTNSISHDTRNISSKDAPGTTPGEDCKIIDISGVDAPSSVLDHSKAKKQDAPDMNYYFPGMEDAPGEKASKEDAPGITAEEV